MVKIHSAGDEADIQAYLVHEFAAHAGTTPEGVHIVLLELMVSDTAPNSVPYPVTLVIEKPGAHDLAVGIEASVRMLNKLSEGDTPEGRTV